MKNTSGIVRVLLPLLCMILLTAVLILSTAAVRQTVWGAFEQPAADQPVITSFSPLDTVEANDMAISAVDGCYDANGTLVAYRLQTETMGFNSDVPITLAVTVSADGTVLRGIDVLSHKESEYYGARITEDDFKNRFTDRYLPVYLTGEAGRGTHIDGISGATVSSKAVVNAVNNAWTFVRTYFIEGE